MIDSRFLFFKEISRFSITSFACTLISCCSIVNDPRQISLPCRVLRDLIIIPHLFPFVKRFLKSFLSFFKNFFDRFFHPARKCPSIISHSLVFVKRFFKSFSTFFRDSFSRPSRGDPLVDSPAVRQPAYYSTSFPFCQQVFPKFFRFGEGSIHVQKQGQLFVQLALFSRFIPS